MINWLQFGDQLLNNSPVVAAYRTYHAILH